jgi:hypothetical protein
MKLFAPSPAAVFEGKFWVVGRTTIGLMIRGEKVLLDIFASDAGDELLVATGTTAVSAETVHRGD